MVKIRFWFIQGLVMLFTITGEPFYDALNCPIAIGLLERQESFSRRIHRVDGRCGFS